MTKRIKMKQRTDSFVVHYPEAIEFAETQLKILWFPNEIKVSKDVHDILTNMTPAEKHGVITVLKLFTLYEAKAGTDYWTGRYMRTYKRPEMQRMASVFGMFELAIHAPFYNLINEALHLNTDEFYESYTQNETLKDRMQFIDDCIRDKDDLFSVAVFSLVEGAILYSSFAFLKHFQTKGKNKLLNTIRGINFSVRDENCLDSNTEIKCIDGWKKITEITLDDIVLQYDQSTKTFIYDTPYNIVKTTSDTSYHFVGNQYEQIVTPNHRMILKDGEVLAKDAVDNMNYLAVFDLPSPEQFVSDMLTGKYGEEYLNEVLRYANKEWSELVISIYNKAE